MRARRLIILGVVTAIVLGLGGFGVWFWRLTPGISVAATPPPPAETEAMLAALRPEGTSRPTIAVIGINDATETTDYLMPTGILRRADIADVVMLATEPGPVQLYPALKVQPDATIGEFDTSHPAGADYVIVPAMSRDDPAVVTWLQAQADKGAVIISVCAGAKVASAAGLLDGRQATTHWFFLRELLQRNPTIRYVADRRMVLDGNVATTTGITASMPMMLTLIEAIAGRAKAEAVALELGVAQWDARHASGPFRLTRPFVGTVAGNVPAFWNRDEVGIALEQGMDEVTLALVADAWSRTYRSKAVTVAGEAITTASGITVLDDSATWAGALSPVPVDRPAAALDATLAAIGARYGESTTDVVAMQLEYPRNGSPP